MSKVRAYGLAIVIIILSIVVIGYDFSLAERDKHHADDRKPDEIASPTPSHDPAQHQGMIDPLGKYEPVIDLSISRMIDSTYQFPEGQTMDQNIWYDTIAAELGIQVNNQWVVNSSQYDQRVNITIISGELPDVMRGVQSYQLEQMVKVGMIEDLTEVYEKYASPLLKSLMQKNGGSSFETAIYDGKIMALPQDVGNLDSLSMIWLRRDWLERLGLQPPETMEDLLAISQAFTEQDPDRNGKHDTYGLALTKDFYQTGFFELIPFFNGFHAYPQQWIRNDEGKLVYGSIQPEMREALLVLQQMFLAGQMDPEFSVKDSSKASELIGSNQIGMFFGRNWNAVHPLNMYRTQQQEMVWEAYPIVSVDGQPALAQINLKPNGYYVVRAGYEHAEALIKMMNFFVAIRANPTEEQFQTLLNLPQEDGSTIEVFKYAPVDFILPNKNQEIYQAVNYALDTGDQSRLNAEMMSAYEDILQYKEGDEQGWPSWIISRRGEGHARTVLEHYIEHELYLPDAYMGNDTETMVGKLPTLKIMEIEMFTKIVQGDSIALFDQFVEFWNSLGGDEMTAEVNEWDRLMRR